MVHSQADKIKWAYVTHVAPPQAVAAFEKRADDPRVGDVALFKVLTLGKHTRMDSRDGFAVNLFPGDQIALAFGNRYATDQYEGYVPPAGEHYHMLSIGGVCGMVGSKNERMPEPTLLEFLGYAIDRDGAILNLKSYRLRRAKTPEGVKRPKTILSIGASMNSGKTTTAAMTVRGLTGAGFRVMAAKLTGTGAVKDLYFMRDAGAEKVLDFTDYGCPSTYRASLRKLLRLTRAIHTNLAAAGPDYIVYEVADGIFQRETAMLLNNEEFRSYIDYVLFAAVDSLSADSGKRAIEGYGLKLVGFSGIVSASELGKIEVQKATGLPCMSSREMSEGGIVHLLSGEAKVRVRRPVATERIAPPAGPSPTPGR